MRLQKYISACGVCSRRKAEELIAAGRVTVNGRTAALGESVDETVDEVCLDGERLTLPRRHTYIMLNKPAGYVTTLSDPQGRPTVAELVEDVGVRLYPVGRLDLMSEGLLLMTDDGEAANQLAHPAHGVKKTYLVRVRGDDPGNAALGMTQPIEWQGVRYQPAGLKVLQASGRRARLEITLSEGKNREIRNMCAALGLQVERLVRIAQGGLSLGDLPTGRWRRLSETEIRSLMTDKNQKSQQK